MAGRRLARSNEVSREIAILNRARGFVGVGSMQRELKGFPKEVRGVAGVSG